MIASQSLNPESRKRGGGEEREGKRRSPTHPKHKPTRGTQKFSGPDALVVVVVVAAAFLLLVVVVETLKPFKISSTLNASHAKGLQSGALKPKPQEWTSQRAAPDVFALGSGERHPRSPGAHGPRRPSGLGVRGLGFTRRLR